VHIAVDGVQDGFEEPLTDGVDGVKFHTGPEKSIAFFDGLSKVNDLIGGHHFKCIQLGG
jgi:hypothetical protein